MTIWHLGAAAVSARLRAAVVPTETFLARLTEQNIARVPGTAVFLTRTASDAPPVLMWHLRHNRSLHERVIILTVATRQVPYVDAANRLTVSAMAPDIWRVRALSGFMERPDVPALLEQAKTLGCGIDLSDVTYFVGHETVVAREDGKGLPRWLEAMYAFMQRNSAHVTDYFQLPADTVVELGREIAI